MARIAARAPPTRGYRLLVDLDAHSSKPHTPNGHVEHPLYNTPQRPITTFVETRPELSRNVWAHIYLCRNARYRRLERSSR